MGEVGRLTHHGWHHSLGLDPRLYKYREWAEDKQVYTLSFLSALDCGCGVASCSKTLQ